MAGSTFEAGWAFLHLWEQAACPLLTPAYEEAICAAWRGMDFSTPTGQGTEPVLLRALKPVLRHAPAPARPGLAACDVARLTERKPPVGSCMPGEAMLAVLVARGADPWAVAPDGRCPWFEAARWGLEAWCIHVLGVRPIDSEALSRHPATRGLPPLHRALEQGYSALADALVAHGADVNLVAEDGRRPLDCTSCTEDAARLHRAGAYGTAECGRGQQWAERDAFQGRPVHVIRACQNRALRLDPILRAAWAGLVDTRGTWGEAWRAVEHAARAGAGTAGDRGSLARYVDSPSNPTPFSASAAAVVAALQEDGRCPWMGLERCFQHAARAWAGRTPLALRGLVAWAEREGRSTSEFWEPWSSAWCVAAGRLLAAGGSWVPERAGPALCPSVRVSEPSRTGMLTFSAAAPMYRCSQPPKTGWEHRLPNWFALAAALRLLADVPGPAAAPARAVAWAALIRSASHPLFDSASSVPQVFHEALAAAAAQDEASAGALQAVLLNRSLVKSEQNLRLRTRL